MKINSDITSKLISIQKGKEADNYMFENNRFLLFSFALLTKTSTVLKKLFEDLDYTIEEISLYVSILKENELFNLEDEKNLKRISKKEKRNLTEEMEAIIEHLNKQVSRKLTLNSSREKRLRTLLEEGYSVEDFKAVNFYFAKTWGNNLEMKKYIRPETLYNHSFERRLDEAKSFFEGFNSYKNEIEILCNRFNKIIENEIYSQEKLLKANIEEELHKKLPMSLQNTIIHWLEKGFSIDIIIQTIEFTIESWSSHHIYKNHISISKILDSKFPDRVNAVYRKLENKDKFTKEINDIENDFKKYIDISLNEDTKERIKSLLSSKLYLVNDFKLVNLYFFKKWYKEANMSEYFKPDTLYNEKFDKRLEEAKESQEKYLKIENQLKEIKKIENKITFDKGKNTYEMIPLDILNKMYIVLMDNSLEEVLKVINFYDLPIEKSLDSKFSSRLAVVRKEEEKKENNFKKETIEVIKNLKSYNNKEELNEKNENLIKKLLNNYSVEDLKKVNLYFFKKWDKQSNMKEYIRATTLYNEKFDTRLKEAQNSLDNYLRYKEEIDDLYLNFEDIFKKNIDINSNNIYESIDLLSLNSIVNWLDRDYDIFTIEKTIKKTIDNWKNHETYKNYINIPKILDEKFPFRVDAIKKQEVSKFKPSQENIMNWLNKGEEK